MTLFILEHDRRTILRRWLRRDLIWTGACGLFSAVYENFSHGVFSNWMIFLFLFPLLGGVLPTLALLGLGERLWLPDRAARNLWDCGVATLAVGSGVAGVLKIYGTTSDYLPVYGIVGGILLIAGALTYGLRRFGLLKNSPEP